MEIPPGSLAIFLILVTWIIILVAGFVLTIFPGRFVGKSAGDVRRKEIEHEHDQQQNTHAV